MRRETLVADSNEDPDVTRALQFLPEEMKIPKSLLSWLSEIEDAVLEQAPEGPARDAAIDALHLARRAACWQRVPN